MADLTLDTGRCKVARGDTQIDLPKLSYHLLLALVRAAPNVLTPDDIADKVWADRHVSPETITQRIKLLRAALGDDAAHPRYVIAVRGQGYRLIPSVQKANIQTSPARPWPRHRLVIAYGVLLVAVTLLTSIQIYLSSRESPSSQASTTAPAPFIAVLPFANFSTDPKHAYFAAAMHNDLLTYLSKLSSLRVISRTSVLAYEERLLPLPEIGEELGVTAILEGSVQRAGMTVRINVQLINAEKDEHLWAEIYDEKLTAENLFSIQTDIATSIADTLEAVLLPADVARLNEVPTTSTEAYDFYLSGNAYLNRPDDRAFIHLAVQQYERATDADPDFALAWAALSRAHSLIYWYSVDATAERLELALAAVQRAFALDPDLAEAHLALGQYYYQGFRDHDAALAEYALAERGLAGTSGLFFARSMIFRRMGHWEEAFETLNRARELDPRNVDLLVRQTDTHLAYRNYAEADRHITRALDIEPDNAFAHFWKVWIPLVGAGDVTAAKAAASAPPVELGRWRQLLGWRAALYERDYDRALRYLDDWDIDVFAQQMYYVPKSSHYAVTYSLAGRHDLAENEYRAARAHLEEALEAAPEDPRRLISLAEALAGLGRRDEALTLAYRSMELLPASEDAIAGPVMQLEAVMRVFAPLADTDAAIKELDAFLSLPGGSWSIEGLLPDPRLDPIREDPQFRELVAEYSRP